MGPWLCAVGAVVPGNARRRSTSIVIILDGIHWGVLPLPTMGAQEVAKVQCPEHGSLVLITESTLYFKL